MLTNFIGPFTIKHFYQYWSKFELLNSQLSFLSERPPQCTFPQQSCPLHYKKRATLFPMSVWFARIFDPLSWTWDF